MVGHSVNEFDQPDERKNELLEDRPPTHRSAQASCACFLRTIRAILQGLNLGDVPELKDSHDMEMGM